MIRSFARMMAVSLAFLGSAAHAETLTIAMSGGFTTLDPHQAVSIQPDLNAISHIYSPLLTRGPDLKLKGVVAESWTPVNDTTWSFKLRPGIKFANGEPLDAAAVKWNIDHILNPETKSRVRGWYNKITEVKVISPTEVQFLSKDPFPALPAQLSMLYLVSPKWIADKNNPATSASGTGPYEVVSYTPGERLILKARPDYFGEKPVFDNVVFQVMADPAARLAAIQTGDVDIVGELPPSEIPALVKGGRVKAGSVESGRMMSARLNNYKAPFADNKKLRQALNYAVDKQAINDGLYGGQATVSKCQLLSRYYFGFNENAKPYPYDVKKARQLIAESGVKTPLELEFDVPLGRYLLATETAQVIASQLEEIGVKVSIREMEFGSWLNKYNRKEMSPISIMTQGWPTLDADGWLSLYDPVYPSAYWSDQTFVDLISKARGEMNEKKRLEYYREATERMCDEAPVIFLFAPPTTYATTKRVEWTPRPDDWVRAFEVKLVPTAK